MIKEQMVSYGAVEELNRVSLTVNEEVGLAFEGEISELLFSLGINHNEFPHLFREDFKKNIRKGVDFPNLIINDVTIDLEAKNWSRVFPCWIDKVTDRFEGSTANYKIVVVNNYLKAGWNKVKHLLSEYNIIPMSIETLTKLIQKLKKKPKQPLEPRTPNSKHRACNTISKSIISLCSKLHSILHSTLDLVPHIVLPQPHVKQFYDNLLNPIRKLCTFPQNNLHLTHRMTLLDKISCEVMFSSSNPSIRYRYFDSTQLNTLPFEKNSKSTSVRYCKV